MTTLSINNDEAKQRNRERARKWYHDNKEKALARLTITNKKWRQANRQKVRKINYAYSRRHPWVIVYRYIITRVNTKSGYYFDRKIKNFLTVTQIKELWIRDKASELKRPSIDRIDPDKDYSFENCRFIELSKNIGRAKKRHAESKTRLRK